MLNDPVVAGLEGAFAAIDAGDLAAARRSLAHLDVGYARELRRTKLGAVAGTPRAQAAGCDARAKRGSLSVALKRQVFARDQYTCRLCGMQTVDLDVLKTLSKVFPSEFPYHSAWRQDVVSPVYWTHATSLEHVVPIARGGAHEPSNFVTSCYGCNDARVDYLLEEVGWELRAITPVLWLGLRNYLPGLRSLAANLRSPP